MTNTVIPDHPSQATEEEPSEGRASLPTILREVVETLLLAAVIYLIVNFFTMRCEVDGPSMQPTLETGQRLVVYRLAYVFSEPERGDVVVFHSPLNPDDNLVKRIIGLPGEIVSIQDGHIYIDGELLEEPDFIPEPYYSGTWEVPEGHYFVLGDNRNASNDSHGWGEAAPIAAEEIIGRAWISYWPPDQWGVIEHFRGYNTNTDGL
jgi:signal peptidase I